MSALVLREFKRIDGTSEHIRSQAEMMLQVLCIERGDMVMTMTLIFEPPSLMTRYNVLL
jgi:surfactin synthase thioesterase subunit